ncbi:hypothetical protein [Prauserella shujinwangii]|uniref:hypothetical protein n=1 Tax=Prauserella shujinwangii TaxID=1453103 RepID=UPI001FECEE2D|nr:hypothetical protein [Prauserella shujinwangii]
MDTDPNGDPVPDAPEGDYTGDGVPNFDYVRDRIENRFATATGATELAEGTPEAEQLDQRMAERNRAARERLDEIRRSMEE